MAAYKNIVKKILKNSPQQIDIGEDTFFGRLARERMKDGNELWVSSEEVWGKDEE